MSRVHVLLGKFGDAVNAIQILYHEFQKSGQRQNLMISKEYASILEGVSYVQPVIFDGHFSDLKGAIKQAKRDFDEVIVAQVYGKDFPMEYKTPSFQLDQWLRAGCMESFGQWPLVFDRRDANREAALLKEHTDVERPFILLADHSESSPFEKKEELAKVLQESFGKTHDIIRLSEIRAERLYDMLALYDNASALVTIETAHLHLSAASDVPVFTLATDKPSLWHGSFWQKRFRFYARYGQWDSVKAELIQGLKLTLDGTPLDTKAPEPHQEARWWRFCGFVPPLSKQAQISTMDYAQHAYNPSVIEFNGRQLVAFRHHRDRMSSELSMGEGDAVKPILPPPGTESLSIEDPRLFIFKGKLHISYVVAKIVPGNASCICAYGELEEGVPSWTIKNHTVPQTGKNSFGHMEKNFVFFESEGKLHMIYTAEPHTVMELNGEKIVKAYTSSPVRWPYGQIRGGAILPYFKGQLLRFFHSHDGKRPDRYYIGAMIMEAAPPFKVLQVSKEPILYGSPWEKENVFHWKSNVVYPGGAIKNGDGYLVSIGVNDSRCCLVKVSEQDLNL